MSLTSDASLVADEYTTSVQETATELGGGHEGLDILDDMGSSDGSVEDLSSSQIEAIRAMFEDETGLGLFAFTWYICGAQDLYPPLHFEICTFLSKWGKLKTSEGWVERPAQDADTVLDSWRRLHLCIPRDHFKTTLGSRALPLWVVTKNPEYTVGIFNENEAKAKSWVGATKSVIVNSKLYHVLWPHVLPPGVHFREKERGISIPRTWKWGDTGIRLNRESHMVAEQTIEPFGIGGATAGKHFTHVIKDDIIGDKAAESEAVMQDAIQWLDHARALERPAENGCELFNYTRWGYFDAYKHTLQKWDGEYKVYLRHMLEGPNGEPDIVNGKVIFPTRFTTTQAKRMYEQDPFVFMSQYMCIPMSGRTTSFQHSWVRSGSVIGMEGDDPYFLIDPKDYEPRTMHADLKDYEERAPNLIPLAWMNKAIILDPAPSKNSERKQEPRARNAIVVVGKDPWGRNFHLESVPLREDPVPVLYEIVRLAQKWHTTRVAIEEVNFSAIYAPLWNRILYHEFPELFIEWITLSPKGRDKQSRILAMQPMMREGFWFFNKDLSGYTIQELLEFPNGETKDLIDALAYTEDFLQREETPDERVANYLVAEEMDRGRNPVTGY